MPKPGYAFATKPGHAFTLQPRRQRTHDVLSADQVPEHALNMTDSASLSRARMRAKRSYHNGIRRCSSGCDATRNVGPGVELVIGDEDQATADEASAIRVQAPRLRQLTVDRCTRRHNSRNGGSQRGHQS